MSDKVRLNITLSKDLDETLEQLASTSGISKTDVFRQALALLKVAHEEKQKGHELAFTKDGEHVNQRIVGLI